MRRVRVHGRCLMCVLGCVDRSDLRDGGGGGGGVRCGGGGARAAAVRAQLHYNRGHLHEFVGVCDAARGHVVLAAGYVRVPCVFATHSPADNVHNRTAFAGSGQSSVIDYDQETVWYIEGGMCQYW